MVGLLYGDDDLDRAVAFEQATHRDYPKKLFDDTLDVLNVLGEAGMHLGLVTASTRASLITDLEVAGIPEELFGYTQTQDDTEFHKPDKRVFNPTIAWLGTLSILPSEAVYVGDGLHDMQAALDSGFEFIGITTGLVTQPDFDSNNVNSVSRLKDLIDI
jgi:phosphoglycolate phosphatase